MLESGPPAPPFTLKDASGHAWSLEALHKKGPVVVFFYPRDNSPFCTMEACAFRDGYEDFLAAGASVVGVSSDSEESHRGFSKRQRLPFLLLSDTGGATRKAYRVPRTLGLVDGRATFVIDQAGIVRMAFSAQLQTTGHMEKALETVRQLKADAASSAPASH